MSNTVWRLTRCAASVTFALFPVLASSGSNNAGPLDPASHRSDGHYKSDFDKPILPLDASLPWRERFTSDGAFDERFKLGSESEPAPPESTKSTGAPGPSDTVLDARGVVREIRSDTGKLKIAHGPIDRYGMPGMTMMFNLADPAMIEGLTPNDEIEFDVDMDASGFTITKIRRTGDSQ